MSIAFLAKCQICIYGNILQSEYITCVVLMISYQGGFCCILDISDYNRGEGISNSRQIFLWLVWPKINLLVIGSLLWIYHCITEQWLRHTFCGLKWPKILLTTKKAQINILLYISGSLLKVHPENNVCC